LGFGAETGNVKEKKMGDIVVVTWRIILKLALETFW